VSLGRDGGDVRLPEPAGDRRGEPVGVVQSGACRVAVRARAVREHVEVVQQRRQLLGRTGVPGASDLLGDGIETTIGHRETEQRPVRTRVVPCVDSGAQVSELHRTGLLGQRAVLDTVEITGVDIESASHRPDERRTRRDPAAFDLLHVVGRIGRSGRQSRLSQATQLTQMRHPRADSGSGGLHAPRVPRTPFG
jgi:hypothetical protein